VLGNDEPEASPAGEITYNAEFYDYRAKYEDTTQPTSPPTSWRRPPSGRELPSRPIRRSTALGWRVWTSSTRATARWP
jgi:hypothetical protein